MLLVIRKIILENWRAASAKKEVFSAIFPKKQFLARLDGGDPEKLLPVVENEPKGALFVFIKGK